MDALFRKYERWFYASAMGIVRNADDADDVCQQAYLKAMEHQDRIREPAALKSWIAKTIVTESLVVARDHRREDRARPAVSEIRGPLGPEEQQRQEEQHRAVLAALERLPDPERVVVVFRKMQGMSGKQAADLLGTNQVDVSRKLQSGMALLRGMLGEWKEGF